MAKKKFKVGQKVIFVKSKVSPLDDSGIMDRHIGTIGTITEVKEHESDNTTFHYIAKFDDEHYSVGDEELCKITKAVKVLYGL